MSSSSSSSSRKLEFGTTFYGREVERRQLKDAYLRRDSRPVAVLLGGLAGTGKTRLVEQALRELQEDVKGGCDASPFYVCSGKADELLSTDPFSSIVGAFSALARELKDDTRLRQRILRAVGSEGRVLTQVIPELKLVIGDQPELQASSTTATRNRFTYLFRAFLKAICTPRKPLILYLDDLQWTDASSMELITGILTDPDLSYFLFIGSYRDNEIEPGHPLSSTLQALRENAKPYLTMMLGNLTRPQVHQLIEDTLRRKDVEMLVEAVYRKTQGNVYSIQTALRLLEQREALRYVGDRWEWDDFDDAISDSAAAMDLDTLRDVDEDAQVVLMTAAFLRSTFDLNMLHEVLTQRSDWKIDVQGLVQILERGVKEHLLENTLGTEAYRFAHDRVRQAFLMLAESKGEGGDLSLRVGKYLLATHEAGEAWMFFAGVDHWNLVPAQMLAESGCSSFRLASLNLEAGKRASAVAAFSPASTYLRKGVALLEEDPERWRSDYALCLEMYNLSAEVEFCVGSLELGERQAQEVLDNARLPMDKIRVSMSRAEALGRHERHLEALTIYKQILTMFHEAPKGLNLFGIARKLQKTKASLRKMSVEDIATSPELVDRERVIVVEALVDMGKRAAWSGDKLLYFWSVLRVCEIAATEDPPVLDPELGNRINSATKQLAERLNARSLGARLRFNEDCWSGPHSSIMDRLLSGYFVGMETGDFEFGFLDRATFVVYQFVCGLPLEAALEDCNSTCDLIDQYQVQSTASVIVHIKDLFLALTGRVMDPFEWTRTDDVTAATTLERTSSVTSLAWKYMSRVQVTYYLQRYDLAEEALACFDVVSSDDKAYLTIITSTMFQVLVNTARYRETKQRRFRLRARKQFRWAQTKIRPRTRNLLHKFKLLEADMESTFRSKKTKPGHVKELFDEAIAEALAGKYIQDAALANELAGEYLLTQAGDHGNPFWLRHYFTNAHTLYMAWEAKAKVRLLRSRRGAFIDLETSEKLPYSICKARITKSLPVHDDLGVRLTEDHASSMVLSETTTC